MTRRHVLPCTDGKQHIWDWQIYLQIPKLPVSHRRRCLRCGRWYAECLA